MTKRKLLGDLTFEVAAMGEEMQEMPAFLATFPGVLPPADLPFTCTRDGASNALAKKQQLNRGKSSHGSGRVVLTAETERVMYRADTLDGDAVQALPCRYLLGTYNPSTHKVTVREAPVVHVEQTIKNVALQAAVHGQNAGDTPSKTYALQRRDLGETFGTRKAKSAIRSYERGQIDVATLNDSTADLIHAQIDGKAEHSALQTPAMIERAMLADRPVPPFNADTEDVEQVYAFNALITEAEAKTIPVAAVMAWKKAEWAEARAETRFPAYVMERLETAVRSKDERRVQALLYVTYLIRFRAANEGTLNRVDALNALLVDASATVQHRLFQLFTEQHEGKPSATTGLVTARYKMPAVLKDKLTAYICALCLHIDGFSVVPTTLAKDLQVTNTKMIDAFRQLGCVTEAASVNGASCRKACLKAPVVFPKPPRRRM